MKKQIIVLMLLLGVLVIPPVLATVKLTEIDTIPVRNYTMYLALTPDDSKLYVVGSTALSVIDILAKRVVTTI